ncbi:MAG: hypothetical protein GKR93_00695 [Gammaproteobacteria bacterium]|nr:hypothetical protein [Gammaproteobacteria bacterium]
MINPKEKDELVLNDRGPYPGKLKAGDVISMRSGGGGGWGDPLSRDPEQVLADVRDERISIDDARDVYKVAINISGSLAVLDSKKTDTLRATT